MSAVSMGVYATIRDTPSTKNLRRSSRIAEKYHDSFSYSELDCPNREQWRQCRRSSRLATKERVNYSDIERFGREQFEKNVVLSADKKMVRFASTSGTTLKDEYDTTVRRSSRIASQKKNE